MRFSLQFEKSLLLAFFISFSSGCPFAGNANYKSIEQILNKKHASVEGKFGCKGYDTFGPFKLVGGIAKGHPDDKDIQYEMEFVKDL